MSMGRWSFGVSQALLKYFGRILTEASMRPTWRCKRRRWRSVNELEKSVANMPRTETTLHALSFSLSASPKSDVLSRVDTRSARRHPGMLV